MLIGQQEACVFLGVSKPTLLRFIKQGLPVVRIKGAQARIDTKDLEKWIEDHKKTAKKEEA